MDENKINNESKKKWSNTNIEKQITIGTDRLIDRQIRRNR